MIAIDPSGDGNVDLLYHLRGEYYVGIVGRAFHSENKERPAFCHNLDREDDIADHALAPMIFETKEDVTVAVLVEQVVCLGPLKGTLVGDTNTR